MATTIAALAEQALRRLGVAIVAEADRPALTAIVTVAEIASRAVQGLGVVVPAAAAPPLSAIVSIPVIAVSALKLLGVIPPDPGGIVPVVSIGVAVISDAGGGVGSGGTTGASSGGMVTGTVVTVTDIAAKALQVVGVVVPAASEPATSVTIPVATLATNALIALAVIASDETPPTLDQALAVAKVSAVHDALVDQGICSWVSTAIPQAVSEDYVTLAALHLASAFGKTADPAQQPVLEARIRKIALIMQAQAIAEQRVSSIHDGLVDAGFASWSISTIPQAVFEDYVTIASASLAPVFGVQADGALVAPARAHVARVAIVLQAETIAEGRVAAIHDGLVAQGVCSWSSATIPQAVYDEYVTLTALYLAPLFEQKGDPAQIPVLEARIRRVALVMQAQTLAQSKVAAVQDSLVAQAFVSWAVTAIPQAVSEDYAALTAMHLAPLFDVKMDPAAVSVLEQRVRKMALMLSAVEVAAAAVLSVHWDLVARGKARWTVHDIPHAVENVYTYLGAYQIAPLFGMKPSKDDQQDANNTLNRLIMLPSSGEPAPMEAF